MVKAKGFLVDSVILIDHFNGVEAATRFLAREGRLAAISAITRAEVLTGFDAEQLPLATSLLDTYRFLPMDVAVADEAARIRRGTRLRLPDAIQVAFAVCHGLRLATRDARDFLPAKFDFIVVPYRL